MMMETERLFLRRWKENDAGSLYEYASDPEVGPIAGWSPHKSVAESLDVIQNVLSGTEAYAVCLKSDNKAIGAIELKLNGHTDMTDGDAKSKRVQEKCGFRYQWTTENVDVPLMHEKRTEHVNCLTKEEWEKDK